MEALARGWTATQVVEWLALPKYSAMILEQDVNGLLLFDLNEENWKEVGVESGVDRKRYVHQER
jgi:hypothetical protein